MKLRPPRLSSPRERSSRSRSTCKAPSPRRPTRTTTAAAMTATTSSRRRATRRRSEGSAASAACRSRSDPRSSKPTAPSGSRAPRVGQITERSLKLSQLLVETVAPHAFPVSLCFHRWRPQRRRRRSSLQVATRCGLPDVLAPSITAFATDPQQSPAPATLVGARVRRERHRAGPRRRARRLAKNTAGPNGA